MLPEKAIVIGAGVAGMATAIRLSVQGFDVTIFEKNNYPGGKLYAFEKDGYHFDAGPSLFTQPENIEELFTLAGEPMEEYFTCRPVDISCRYFYENEKRVAAYSNTGMLVSELHRQLNEDPASVIKYLSSAERNYKKTGAVFLNNSLHKRKTWFNKNILHAIRALKPSYILKNLNSYNKAAFNSPETIQLFNRFATYNGSNPYKAPAMLSLIPHLEFNEGVYYPAGGMISITNALYKLARKKGVHFVFDQPVDKIIVNEGKALGVVANNENIFADAVVSNTDVYFTYKNLLTDEYRAKKHLKQERSSSAVVFYWGIGKQFDELALHNILFSNNYEDEFHSIFKRKTLSADPTVYINITSKMDAGHAPTGSENWFVMINAPANAGQDWEAYKPEIKKQVISKINRMLKINIEKHIETETTLDPVMIEQQTGSFMGSLYGASSNSRLSAFLRHPNFSGNTRYLYFCGGTVHPGGGIPLCLKSAKITSTIIETDIKKRRKH